MNKIHELILESKIYLQRFPEPFRINPAPTIKRIDPTNNLVAFSSDISPIVTGPAETNDISSKFIPEVINNT